MTKKGVLTELQRLRRLVGAALEATAPWLPTITLLYAWVWRAAHIFG